MSFRNSTLCVPYSQIYTGQRFWVDWVDPNYPCDCECHRGTGVMHFMPCCYDSSWGGFAFCLAKIDFWVLVRSEQSDRSPRRLFIVRAESLRASTNPGRPDLEIEAWEIEQARAVLRREVPIFVAELYRP